MEAHVKDFNKLEEIFDMENDVFEIVLSFGPIHELKNKLKTLETQGICVHGIHKSYFLHFCPNQSLKFLNFVMWCETNYSQSEQVIMDSSHSKIL